MCEPRQETLALTPGWVAERTKASDPVLWSRIHCRSIYFLQYMAEGPPSHSPLSLGATIYSGSGVGRHKTRDSRTWAILTTCRKIGSSRYLVSAQALKIDEAILGHQAACNQRHEYWRMQGIDTAIVASNAGDSGGERCRLWLSVTAFLLFFVFRRTAHSALRPGLQSALGQSFCGNETFVTDWITSSKPNSAVQMLHK